eukprot:88002-Chlamydomonas_euryale.AAC.1
MSQQPMTATDRHWPPRTALLTVQRNQCMGPAPRPPPLTLVHGASTLSPPLTLVHGASTLSPPLNLVHGASTRSPA